MVPLGVLSTGLAFVWMALLVGRVGGPRGAVAIYFVPVVAVALGVVLLGERLAPGTVILFDDVREPGQPEVLRRWETESGVNVELRETEEVSFALVTCP